MGQVVKDSCSDLAILGGPAAFAEPLYVGRPNVGDRARLLARIEDMLDRRWFTNNGPFIQEFERKLADMLGVRHAIAMCNATIALEIAIRALGMHGEVIVPSFTFVATAHALQWQEITPVFCDIDPETHCIDPLCIEKMLTPRTTGIIGVHVWGNTCNVEDLESMAKRRGLKLIFDAAHAIGCSHGGMMVGNFGECEILSFHATKICSAFEASAAMAITSLESLDSYIEVNKSNYHDYRNRLAGLPGIRFVEHCPHDKRNYQYVVVEVDEEAAGISRDTLIAVLHAENVMARRYFYPGCHRMEPYRSYFPHAGLMLPVTERVASRVLVLPTGTAIQESHIAAICDIIRTAIEHGAQITDALSGRDS